MYCLLIINYQERVKFIFIGLLYGEGLGKISLLLKVESCFDLKRNSTPSK